jgi:hypothetical protein
VPTHAPAQTTHNSAVRDDPAGGVACAEPAEGEGAA